MPRYDMALILTLFQNESRRGILLKFGMFQEQVFLSMATSKL